MHFSFLFCNAGIEGNLSSLTRNRTLVPALERRCNTTGFWEVPVAVILAGDAVVVMEETGLRFLGPQDDWIKECWEEAI